MSEHLFNIGDKQRLDREESLATQLPRQMASAANDSMMNTERQAEEFSEGGNNDFIFDGLLEALRRRSIT